MSMMPASPRLRVSRLAATTVLVLLALGITELLQTFLGIPTFFAILPVIVLTAAAWGAAIGILAAMLTTVGMALLLEPRWNLAVADPAERRLLVVFITVAFASVWIAHRYYRLREFTQRNAAEFRALFELAAVGSAAADLRTGRILRANQQFCTITGYSHRELESMTIAQITHPEDRARDRDIISELLSGQRTHWTTEKRYLQKDGNSIWVLVNGSIVPDAEGRPDHAIAHAVDISSRRRAEAEAREASRLKDEFLATLSHELRTPLNVVAGWIHLLSHKADLPPYGVDRALPVLERNVDALRRLTDDLLGMSDVLAGRVMVQTQPVLVDRLLSDIVENLTITARAKSIAVNTHLQSAAVVHGDENRLRQVFANVLSNAMKFTPSEGAITVTSRYTAQRVDVEIADTGIGIAAAFLPHVFDKFRQEDGTHTREHAGLGLGLAVARQFVELHGGTITAASAGRGRGAAFTISLPASRGAQSVVSAQMPPGRPLTH
jgi:PAS domain S-box-containing protein